MNKPVHMGSLCSECTNPSEPLLGWRHKCLNCANYDLCEICFRYTTHDRSHAFVVLKQPCHLSPMKLLSPILSESLYPTFNPALCSMEQFPFLFGGGGVSETNKTKPREASPPSRIQRLPDTHNFNFGYENLFGKSTLSLNDCLSMDVQEQIMK